jgi:hypothetical protein
VILPAPTSTPLAATARIVQTDEAITVTARGLCLAFRNDGRRWSHTLDLDGRRVAWSLEWDPDRDDPAFVPSPAYQQSHVHQGDRGPQIMLVGQWGPRHGSAVFTVVESAGTVVVEVDVAVHTRAEPRPLAATYRVELAPAALVDAGAAGVIWRTVEPRGSLAFEAAGPPGQVAVAMSEAGPRGVQVQAVAPAVAGGPTQRLRYRWRWDEENAHAVSEPSQGGETRHPTTRAVEPGHSLPGEPM